MPSTLEIDRLEFAVLAYKADLNRMPLVASFSHYATPIYSIPRQFAEAEERCRERGLLDGHGRLTENVAAMIDVFERTSVEYDLRYSSEKDSEVRAVVSTAGDIALRTVVNKDNFVLDKVRPSEAVSALAGVLPELAPARVQPPLSVELDALQAAMAEVKRQGDEDPRALDYRLRERGVSVSSYRKMTRLLDEEPRSGLGEIGVTTWGPRRQEHRGAQTIRIVDLGVGRVALYNSGNRRMLAGADVSTYQRLISEILADAKKAAMQ